MKIVYFSDNRENYRLGNYYCDWIQAFQKKFPKTILFGKGYETRLEALPSKPDLVVYGHGFIDDFVYNTENDISRNKYHGFDLTSYFKIPSVLFSKNEYKLMDKRIQFMKQLKDCLLVVYCRETKNKYKLSYQNIFWIPFGANINRFVFKEMDRDIDIGMRGNEHQSYIGDLRKSVHDKIKQQLSYLNIDVQLSKSGEHFLFGEAYYNWLSRSKFVANTVAAMNIVNPKFAETIASGAIPLAPVNEYEGLLRKDKEYVDIDELLQHVGTPQQFLSYYQEKHLLTLPFRESYIKEYSYDRLVNVLFDRLNGTYPSNDQFIPSYLSHSKIHF